MNTKRPAAIPSLTGIRGVASLWVIVYHLTLTTAGTLLQAPSISKFPLFARGWVGVDLFFSLSGFILMHSHSRDFVTLSIKNAARFAKLRFLRVYPLNWVVLGLIGLICLADSQFWTALQHWSVGGNPVSALFRTALLGTQWLPGTGDWNSPTWSLSSEVVGYAAFPALAWGLVRTDRFEVLWGIAIVALTILLAYEVVTDSVGSNLTDALSSFIRMGCNFVAGAALARARMVTPNWFVRNAGSLSVAVTVLIIVSLFSWRGIVLLPAQFVLLIFLLSFQQGSVDRVLTARPVLFLGHISFSLYLIHVQLLLFMEIHFLPLAKGSRTLGIALIVGYFAVTVPLSWLLYCQVERPSQRLGRAVVREPAQRLT